MTQKNSKSRKCFWSKCSNHKRCDEFGSCVSIYQSAHKDELFAPIQSAAKAPAVSEADVGRIPHAEVDKTVTDLIRANYSDKPRLALAIGRAIVKANERGIQSADDARSGTVLLLKQVMQTRAVDYVEAQFPGWHNRASATLSRETKLVPSDPPSQEASAPPNAGGR